MGEALLKPGIEEKGLISSVAELLSFLIAILF